MKSLILLDSRCYFQYPFLRRWYIIRWVIGVLVFIGAGADIFVHVCFDCRLASSWPFRWFSIGFGFAAWLLDWAFLFGWRLIWCWPVYVIILYSIAFLGFRRYSRIRLHHLTVKCWIQPFLGALGDLIFFSFLPSLCLFDALADLGVRSLRFRVQHPSWLRMNRSFWRYSRLLLRYFIIIFDGFSGRFLHIIVDSAAVCWLILEFPFQLVDSRLQLGHFLLKVHDWLIQIGDFTMCLLCSLRHLLGDPPLIHRTVF